MNRRFVSREITDRFREGDFHTSYTVQNELGRGRFAVVRKCTCIQSSNNYAAKFVRKRKMGRSCQEDILKEIRILEMSVDHPQMIKLHEVFETPSEVILVLEFAAGGELHPYCVAEKEDAFTEDDVVRLVRQILEGVHYLHQNKIAHLDLKPQNILLTSGMPCLGDIRIIDFGIARLVKNDEVIREIVGTPEYVAPEVLNYEPITLATDMWSIGVLTYVMLTGISPFAADDKQETFLNISQVNLDFPEEYFQDISEDAKDLIKKVCVKEPEKRLTAEECLNHPWLRCSHKESPMMETIPRLLEDNSCQDNNNQDHDTNGNGFTMVSETDSSTEGLESTAVMHRDNAEVIPTEAFYCTDIVQADSQEETNQSVSYEMFAADKRVVEIIPEEQQTMHSIVVCNVNDLREIATKENGVIDDLEGISQDEIVQSVAVNNCNNAELILENGRCLSNDQEIVSYATTHSFDVADNLKEPVSVDHNYFIEIAEIDSQEETDHSILMDNISSADPIPVEEISVTYVSRSDISSGDITFSLGPNNNSPEVISSTCSCTVESFTPQTFTAAASTSTRTSSSECDSIDGGKESEKRILEASEDLTETSTEMVETRLETAEQASGCTSRSPYHSPTANRRVLLKNKENISENMNHAKRICIHVA